MSLADIKARNAADLAAGISRTYPEHEKAGRDRAPGTESRAGAAAIRPGNLRKTLAVLKVDCPDLGAELPGPCGAKLYRCNRYGDVAIKAGECFDSRRSCVACEHHPVNARPPVAFAPVTTRNLLYHVYPVAENGTWQWNVDELCKRLDLFNGRIAVAVAVDPPTGRHSDPTGPHCPGGPRDIRGCDSVADVVGRFGRHADRIEFFEIENDPNLREVATFDRLFSLMAPHTGAGEVTLYAQAKGTTRPPAHVARMWTKALIEILLDYWPVVEDSLRRHPVTGAFRKCGRAWVDAQSLSDWHYSGSWFWFRNAELFGKQNWRKIDQFWSGIEPYPSQHFGKEAGCVFHEDFVAAMNLYSGEYWRRVVNPELDEFRRTNADRKRQA